MKKVMIYSNEHGKWWAEDYCGYTTHKENAGIFDYDKALLKYPYLNYNKKEEDYFVDIPEEEAKQILRERQIRREINESLKKNSVSLSVNVNDIDIDTAKKLKAFEAIKKIRPEMRFCDSQGRVTYIEGYDDCVEITPEEFDLLEELFR